MKKLIILIAFILTGCSSYNEVSNLAIIKSMGIEKIDSQYKLTVEVIDFKNNLFNQETKTVTVNSYSLSDSFNKISLELDKEPFLAHLDLLLINESIKTEELKDIIAYFIDNNQTSENFLILYTETKIEEVLEKSAYNEINELLEQGQKKNSNLFLTTFEDIINSIYNSKEIYLTNINYKDNLTVTSLEKFANNNYQLISLEEGIYFNYLENNIKTLLISHDCAEKMLNYKVINSNTIKQNNKIYINSELLIINNECNYSNKEIEEIYEKGLRNKLEKITDYNVIINTTIRGIK